jgi:tetratricopeptide (TPR) repeat protein
MGQAHRLLRQGETRFVRPTPRSEPRVRVSATSRSSKNWGAPHEPPSRLDLGDRHLDAGEFAEAIRWYQEALDREREHPWALPSLHAARHLQGDAAARTKLEAYAAAHPDNQRAASLVRRGIAYVGYLEAS